MRKIDWIFIAIILAIFVIIFPGCYSRKEIQANVWRNNGLPVSLCGPSKELSAYQELWDYGTYRKLDAGGYEFIPYCKRVPETGQPYVALMYSIYATDLNLILDATLPAETQSAD